MTIQEQIIFLKKLKEDNKDVECIESIIESLTILKNSFSNQNSESVIISMSHHDYVLFEEFKTFKKFTKYNEKSETPQPIA